MQEIGLARRNQRMGFDRHDRFVTVGRSIGHPACAIPHCDRSWLTIPQPIVLDRWPYAGRVQHRAATSVGHWRGECLALAEAVE